MPPRFIMVMHIIQGRATTCLALVSIKEANRFSTDEFSLNTKGSSLTWVKHDEQISSILAVTHLKKSKSNVNKLVFPLVYFIANLREEQFWILDHYFRTKLCVVGEVQWGQTGLRDMCVNTLCYKNRALGSLQAWQRHHAYIQPQYRTYFRLFHPNCHQLI